jgi:hypothetical protein
LCGAFVGFRLALLLKLLLRLFSLARWIAREVAANEPNDRTEPALLILQFLDRQ